MHGWVDCCEGGTEKSRVGISGDSGGGTVTSSVAHDVPGVAFEVCLFVCLFISLIKIQVQ